MGGANKHLNNSVTEINDLCFLTPGNSSKNWLLGKEVILGEKNQRIIPECVSKPVSDSEKAVLLLSSFW